MTAAALQSCLYLGWVAHRRLAPAAHAFRWPVFFTWLDLGELDRVFAGRWLWSARRPAAPPRRRPRPTGRAGWR